MGANQLDVIGFDPSSNGGTAWAHLRVGPSERIYIERGELDDEAGIRTLLKGLALKPQPWIVGVEVVERGLNSRRGDEPGARAKARSLISTAKVGEFIRATALAYGLAVEAMPVWVARKYVGLYGKTNDNVVKQALRAACPSWPRLSNDHVRDAAVVAIAAGTVYGIKTAWGSKIPQQAMVTESLVATRDSSGL